MTTPDRDNSNAGDVYISPRAMRLAAQNGIDYRTVTGTGPDGMIIERDIRAAIENQSQEPEKTDEPINRDSADVEGAQPGVVTETVEEIDESSALLPERSTVEVEEVAGNPIAEVISMRGIRKIVGERMYTSIQSTAQVTMTTTADVRAVRQLRAEYKLTPEYSQVTENHMGYFAVARVLKDFQTLNALFDGKTLTVYSGVNLGITLDTEHGPAMPIVKNAGAISLRALSDEVIRLTNAVNTGQISSEELKGGTFTVVDLVSMGIETFTPIITPPQVAILGIGDVVLKPVEVDGSVEHNPHQNLSLTIDHRAIDIVYAARFLKALTEALTHIERLMDS